MEENTTQPVLSESTMIESLESSRVSVHKTKSWADMNDETSSSDSENKELNSTPPTEEVKSSMKEERGKIRYMKTNKGETVKVYVGKSGDVVPYKCYFTEALRLFRIIYEKEEKRETIHSKVRIELGKVLHKIQLAFFHSQEMIKGERDVLKWNQTDETYPDIVRKLFFLPPDEKHTNWHLIKPYGYYINSRSIKVLSLTPIVRKNFERILSDETLTKEVEIFNRYIQRKLS